VAVADGKASGGGSAGFTDLIPYTGAAPNYLGGGKGGAWSDIPPSQYPGGGAGRTGTAKAGYLTLVFREI